MHCIEWICKIRSGLQDVVDNIDRLAQIAYAPLTAYQQMLAGEHILWWRALIRCLPPCDVLTLWFIASVTFDRARSFQFARQIHSSTAILVDERG